VVRRRVEPKFVNEYSITLKHEKEYLKRPYYFAVFFKLPPPPTTLHATCTCRESLYLPHREKKYHEIGKASITAVLALTLYEFSTLLIIISSIARFTPHVTYLFGKKYTKASRNLLLNSNCHATNPAFTLLSSLFINFEQKLPCT